MSWSQRKIEPLRPSGHAPERMRYPCPALFEFGGVAGGVCFGSVAWYSGRWLLGLPWDSDQTPWDAKMVALLAAALIAGAVGGLLGFGLGASIEVKEEQTHHVLNTLWNYLAIGAFLWFFLLMLVLQKTYGQDGTERFSQEIGRWRLGWTGAAVGGGGSLLTGVVLLLAGLLPQDGKPRVAACFVLAVSIALTMAWLQWSLVPLERGYWPFVGAVHGVALVPVCAWFIERGRQTRRQLLKDRP